MKKVLPVIFITAVIAAAVFFLVKNGTKAPEGVMELSGNVEVTEVDTGFEIPGRIARMYKGEGDRVRSGDLLAELDRNELLAVLEGRRAALEEARAILDKLRAGPRPQELRRAREEVHSAEAELEKARRDHERAKVLFEKGAIAEQTLDGARKVFSTALSAHASALEALSLVEEGPRAEDIIAQEKRVLGREADLEVSKNRLEYTSLRAATDGVVLARNFEPGEYAAPGAPVYTIGDLENPWIKVYVKEERLGRIKLGQRAGAMVDTYPGKVYVGKVTHVSDEAEFTPKNIQTKEERVKLVFGVEVSVRNREGELKPGMPADVIIYLD